MFLNRTLIALTVLTIAAPVFAVETNTYVSNQAQATQAIDPANPQTTLVNLNTASFRELMRVKEINATRARAIIAYRKKHGDFKSVDALAKVKGFTKMKLNELQRIQDQLTT